MYGLDCANCPRKSPKIGDEVCKTWGIEGNPYEFEGLLILGEQYTTCPMWPLKSPEGTIIRRYLSAQTIQPLSDWPDSYSAWVEWGIREGRNALNERAIEDQKQSLSKHQATLNPKRRI